MGILCLEGICTIVCDNHALELEYDHNSRVYNREELCFPALLCSDWCAVFILQRCLCWSGMIDQRWGYRNLSGLWRSIHLSQFHVRMFSKVRVVDDKISLSTSSNSSSSSSSTSPDSSSLSVGGSDEFVSLPTGTGSPMRVTLPRKLASSSCMSSIAQLLPQITSSIKICLSSDDIHVTHLILHETI